LIADLNQIAAFCIRRNANGATQTVQRGKQSNLDPNPIPHPKPNPKRLFSPLRRFRCDICVAPNTDSPNQAYKMQICKAPAVVSYTGAGDIKKAGIF